MSEKEQTQFYEELAAEINEDFKKRREERKSLELQWELNMNYLFGNQYCEIMPTGELGEEEKYYSWQNRSVYNHIAPIIDTRTAKLARVRPVMSVRAATDEDSDMQTAKLSTDILTAACGKIELDAALSRGTMWSETCGTVFYKLLWDNSTGKSLGEVDEKEVREGDVKLAVIPAFEIYPDSLFNEDIGECKSIIHAQAMDVQDVKSIYGVDVEGGDVDVYTLTRVGSTGSGGRTSGVDKGLKHNSVVVIEKYEKPSETNINGRIVTVACDKILYIGDLPYINGTDGTRDFPFVKQACLSHAGCFFGVSLIERLIPIQRAYNAVKNRKHEFINRIASGVLTVEDGSVDADELIEDGLCPGKVLVYRQGSKAPSMMSAASVPPDFSYEEERLYNEFINISGVSEISRNSSAYSNITSGVALELLIEQDETRLVVTAENIRRAVKSMAKHILRLYKQFATETRMARISGENGGSELFYFNSSDISSDDVVFDTENELTTTPAQKKNAVYDLLSKGLLLDEKGFMSNRTRAKVLEILGFGTFDSAQDITELHIAKANKENVAPISEVLTAEEFDDHETHITEHIRFLISEDYKRLKNSEEKYKLLKTHIKEHKLLLETENAKQVSLQNEGAPSGGAVNL